MKLKDEREIFFFVKIHSGFLLSVCVCVCVQWRLLEVGMERE